VRGAAPVAGIAIPGKGPQKVPENVPPQVVAGLKSPLDFGPLLPRWSLGDSNALA